MTRLLRKVERRATLDDAARADLLDLPYKLHRYDRSSYLVREGDQPQRSCLVVSGFTYRQKVTVMGARQILSVYIPGDFIDIEAALLNIADDSIQALTACEIAQFATADVRALMCAHPQIALAFWIDSLIFASIFREWIANIGRRDARTRIAHLLCEFARRLEVAGVAEEYRYELPMTQEQLGDAAGLTPVHVNRVLRELDGEGVINRTKRQIEITDWPGLRLIADFNDTYLHLDQIPREPQHQSSRDAA
jgi:CRP-like cAMP-binding protein